MGLRIPFDQNTDKIQGSKVDGVEPLFNAIADGSYPISRPLFVYVKKAHVDLFRHQGIPRRIHQRQGLGSEGYLADKGLIPMPDAERALYAKAAMKWPTTSSIDFDGRRGSRPGGSGLRCRRSIARHVVASRSRRSFRWAQKIISLRDFIPNTF